MATNTTLNMNLKILERINAASDISGKSRSKLIIMLLMKLLDNENHKAGKPGAVQYQERDDKNMWKPFHITLSDQEYDIIIASISYEYFQDLKRLLEMSLSFAVAHAVKKYLDRILSGEDTDNCRFFQHKLFRKVINGEIIWTISWGKPEFFEKLAHINSS